MKGSCLAAPSKKLVLFDLDHTLVAGNASYLFGKYLYRQKQMGFSLLGANVLDYALHKGGLFSLATLHHRIFARQFLGQCSFKLNSFVKAFLAEEFPLHLNKTVHGILCQHQEAGDMTALLSSSPSFLVEPIASLLKVHYVKATDYLVDKSGRYDNIALVMDGPAKGNFARRLQSELSISQSSTIAFSDSILDLPFLEAAGLAIGVNPDRKLASVCRTRGWRIVTES